MPPSQKVHTSSQWACETPGLFRRTDLLLYIRVAAPSRWRIIGLWKFPVIDDRRSKVPPTSYMPHLNDQHFYCPPGLVFLVSSCLISFEQHRRLRPSTQRQPRKAKSTLLAARGLVPNVAGTQSRALDDHGTGGGGGGAAAARAKIGVHVGKVRRF